MLFKYNERRGGCVYRSRISVGIILDTRLYCVVGSHDLTQEFGERLNVKLVFSDLRFGIDELRDAG